MGQVKVHVRGPLLGRFVDTYWHDAFTFNEADLIPIDGADVTADLDLPIGGSVDGQVVEARSGTPVQGARVTATLARAGSSGSVGAAGPASGPGRFSLTGLPPVPLELSVSLPPGSPYLAPSADPSGSSPVHPPRRSGEHHGPDHRPAPFRRDHRGPSSTTRVSRSRDADVRLLGCLPACPPHATSDATGRYRLRAVAPGTHLGVAVARSGRSCSDPGTRAARPPRGSPTSRSRRVTWSTPWTSRLPRPAFVSLDVRGADAAEPLRAIVRLTTLGTDLQPVLRRPGRRGGRARGVRGRRSSCAWARSHRASTP